MPSPLRAAFVAVCVLTAASATTFAVVADPSDAPDQDALSSQQRLVYIETSRVVAAAERIRALENAPEPAPPAPPAATPAPERTVWDRLADCESGDWRDGTPQPGTARWDYGLTFDHGDIFEGGLNFHPRTWDAFRDADMPDHAGNATRAQQIEVGERVLDAQGWGAWPVCSRKLGLR